MREIKFRAWNEESELMITEPAYIQFSSNKDYQVFLEGDSEWVKDNCILMQYTGLNDKNGKEIYEGDIVDQEIWVSVGKYERSIGVVKYKSPEFTSECIGDWAGSNAKLNGNAMVIGNIYENPELLNN